MRLKLLNDKIKLNHRFLLRMLTRQVQQLTFRHFNTGNWKCKEGVKKRKQAIKFILSQDRVIKRTELKYRFKIHPYNKV